LPPMASIGNRSGGGFRGKYGASGPLARTYWRWVSSAMVGSSQRSDGECGRDMTKIFHASVGPSYACLSIFG
jgi:hypothetical protein